LAALAALLAVIDQGSFTAAAQALGISQPAVSLAVKRLEERLDTALVIRSRKGITASRPGETLAQGARLAFEALGGAVAQIADQQVEPRGRVVLGCHESLAAYALPTFMARFLRLYPKVDLALWNGSSMDVEAEIVAGRIDLGLVVNPSQHPDTVVSPLFDDSVELFHCLPARSVGNARSVLSSLPLIYVPQLVQSQNILHELQKRKLVVARPLPCSSLALVKNLVIDRVGVGILPRRVAAHNTSRKLHSLSPPMPRYQDRVALVRRYDLPRTAAMRLVIEKLTSHARDMGEA
jgi:DNA-binding transcriptional LysR family regulator